MSVRLRIGPFSVSSRGRVGVRVGPVSAYGGGHRRKRSSSSNTRRSSQADFERQIVEGEKWFRDQAAANKRGNRSARLQTNQTPWTMRNRQSDPVYLEAWLKAPPPRLKHPERYTQNWFVQHAAEVHPEQITTLFEELVSRGWSMEDIEQKVVPPLRRAVLARRRIIERHKQELKELAIKLQVVEEQKAVRELAAAKRRAARSWRWHAACTAPARVWSRRNRGVSVPVEPEPPAAATLGDSAMDHDPSKVETHGGEATIDAIVRPSKPAEMIGQGELVVRLLSVIAGARMRDTKPPHVLLSGPAGTDKVTPARVVAHELNAKLVTTSGPALRRAGDLAGLLFSLGSDEDEERLGVLFIDEIHRLPSAAEETLYEALKDGTLTVTMGSGETARSAALRVPAFVCVGATTEPGALTQPLRDRFGFHAALTTDSDEELTEIVEEP